MLVVHRSSAKIASTSIRSPSVRRSSLSVPATRSVRLVGCGVSRCLREKASRRRVSSAARSPDAAMFLSCSCWSRDRLSASCSSSTLAMMTIRILLKSCATPPVSWPTASIFCDWRSISSVASLSVTSSRAQATPQAAPDVS